MTSRHRIRLAVEVADTFTDVVPETDDGLVVSTVADDSPAPKQGSWPGVGIVLEKAAITAVEIGSLIHRTLLATRTRITALDRIYQPAGECRSGKSGATGSATLLNNPELLVLNGETLSRDLDAIEIDLHNGLISTAFAIEQYALVFTADGKVDRSASERARQARRSE